MGWWKRLVKWFKRVVLQVKEQPAPVEEGKRGRGRPRKDVCKDVIRPVRWSAVEWEAVTRAAEDRGLNPSEFIRQCVIAETAGKNPPSDGRSEGGRN